MQHRVNEGCGKSVPEVFHVSLCLIEQLGRVPEAERLSHEELWKAHVKAWTAELSSEAPPVKPAEMYTVAILLAFELTVGDDSIQLFARALAWVVLVMVWSSMNYIVKLWTESCHCEDEDIRARQGSEGSFGTCLSHYISHWRGLVRCWLFDLGERTVLLSQGLFCDGTK